MIVAFLIKSMFAIANMSKKAAAIYISLVSVLFLASVAIILCGVIWLDGEGEVPEYAIPFAATGVILLLISLFLVALTSIASNYVRRNPSKDPKAKKEKEK